MEIVKCYHLTCGNIIVCIVNSKHLKNVIYGVKRGTTISHNNIIINEVEQWQTKIKRRKFLQCITSESNISGSCRLSRFFSPLSLFAFSHILSIFIPYSFYLPVGMKVQFKYCVKVNKAGVNKIVKRINKYCLYYSVA